MGPRISLFTARSVAFRTKPTIPQKRLASPSFRQHQQRRAASDDASAEKPAATTPTDAGFKGPNMDPLPHVTEEQAALDKATGGTPPDIEQGTPVQEIFQRDKDAQDKAPEVMKQGLNGKTDSSTPSGSRSFSTSARKNAAEAEMVRFEDTRAVGLEYPGAGFGHKFPLPDLSPLGKAANFKNRYDPLVHQMTRSLMRDGKLSLAQKNMDFILDALRTSPTKGNSSDSDRSLLTPLPRDALPLSPVTYLTAIIDSVAPLVKIRQQKGLMGGGAAMPIPIPLKLRQRRRTAIQWILAAAENRKEVKFAERVAKELINVAEGRGGAWERRQRVHKLAISARANVRVAMGGMRVKRKSIRGKA